MTSERFKRPPLERDRPIRTWATLFGPPAPGARPVASASASGDDGQGRAGPPPWIFGAAGREVGSDAGPLGDAVARGYRVINEYMRQGQAFAQGFHPAPNAAPGPGPDASPGVPPDMQALAQRVMQYGWDFAGLWFELWSRMSGGANGWSPPVTPSPGGSPPANASESAPMPPQGVVAPAGVAGPAPGRLIVSVESPRSTSTSIELRPGAPGPLTLHPLRAESADAPAIEQASIASDPDGGVSITVTVPADQPPGVYNGLIVDQSSRLPRGTFSLTVRAGEVS